MEETTQSIVSIVIVTSPVKSNPDTYLIDTVIDSLAYVEGLQSCHVYIIFDGFVVAEAPRPKSGRITEAMAAAYSEYYEALQQKYNSPKYHLLKSESHRGFAMSVKWGLEVCDTEYAVIIQHDRSFGKTFSQLQNILCLFSENEHIRYVGFPTSCSSNHEQTIVNRYGHKELVHESNSLILSDEYIIKPLMFWYDSTHVAHVKRYLEIYRPFINVPDELKPIFGSKKGVKQMILRNGDFIEDRFGQAQRKILNDLVRHPNDLMKAFRWFGSYLIADNYSTRSQCVGTGDLAARHTVLVQHLRGRTYDPEAERDFAIEMQKKMSMPISGENANCTLKDDYRFSTSDSILPPIMFTSREERIEYDTVN